MNSKKIEDAPLGILLIATFWIFVGGLFLSMNSFGSQNMFMLIFIALGTFFYIYWMGTYSSESLGAYYTSIVLAILGLIPAFMAIPSGIIMHGYFYGISIFVYLLFIPMVWYLFKNMERLVEKQKDKTNILCPQCKRTIPLDSNFCPYCEKKFE